MRFAYSVPPQDERALHFVESFFPPDIVTGDLFPRSTGLHQGRQAPGRRGSEVGFEPVTKVGDGVKDRGLGATFDY